MGSNNKYGISFGDNEANIPKSRLMEDKMKDDKEIDRLVDILFEFNDSEIYFDEFETICEDVCSDLYVAVFMPLY